MYFAGTSVFVPL